MERKEQLQKEIKELEAQIEPKREELHKIYREEEKAVAERIKKANMGDGDFGPDELVYAAFDKCDCGAGMAYPHKIGIHGAWYCSYILRGIAQKEVRHTSPLPFSMYELKSENQPSANGRTTRPQ